MTTASDREKTIRDFGDQWTTFTDNAGYYVSQELLADILAPFLSPGDIQHKRCAEIGAGTGRITCMLLEAGAAHVTAVEPSAAIDVLRSNTAPYGSRG
jgi:predicted RNA methylase